MEINLNDLNDEYNNNYQKNNLSFLQIKNMKDIKF